MYRYLPYVIGAAAAVTGRLLLGEQRVPEFLRNQLSPVADSLSDTSDLLSSLKAETLSNWVKLGEHGIRQAINTNTCENISVWMAQKGVESLAYVEPFAYLPALKKLNWEGVTPYLYPGSKNDPNVYEFTIEETTFYVTTKNTTTLDEVIARLESGKEATFSVYLPLDPHAHRTVMETIAGAFWETYGCLVEVEAEGGRHYVFDYNSEVSPYFGPLWAQPEKWSKGRRNGETCAVVVSGKCGAGKSTFARYATMHVRTDGGDGRVLCFSHESLKHFDSRQWSALCEILRPSCVILEDIDVTKLSSAMQKVLFSPKYRKPTYTIATVATDRLDAQHLHSLGLERHVSVDEMTADERAEFARALANYAHWKEYGDSTQPSVLDDNPEKLAEYVELIEKSPVAHVLCRLRESERNRDR